MNIFPPACFPLYWKVAVRGILMLVLCIIHEPLSYSYIVRFIFTKLRWSRIWPRRFHCDSYPFQTRFHSCYWVPCQSLFTLFPVKPTTERILDGFCNIQFTKFVVWCPSAVSHPCFKPKTIFLARTAIYMYLSHFVACRTINRGIHPYKHGWIQFTMRTLTLHGINA